MQLTGIVLAGGKSSRMGVDKGLITYKGKKLVAYSIDLLRPLCEEILICSNQPGYEVFGIPVVSDNYSGCGPLGGLEAGLRFSNNEINIILSCDSPFLEPELLALLIEQVNDFDCVVPVHANGVEPLAAIYRKRMAVYFEEKIKLKELKLQKIIRERKVLFYNAEFLLEKYPKLFYNLNSEEDLKR